VEAVLRWSGKYYMGFVESLIFFVTVQNLWKWVHIWQSYHRLCNALFSWTQYSMQRGKNEKLCCFNQLTPLFLSVPSVGFTGSLLVALSRFVGGEIRMETLRWTVTIPQMLKVTTSGIQLCRQSSATTLLMCSCGSSSQMVCKATFKSSVVLGFGYEVRTW